jgi:hypothetical protein
LVFSRDSVDPDIADSIHPDSEDSGV